MRQLLLFLSLVLLSPLTISASENESIMDGFVSRWNTNNPGTSTNTQISIPTNPAYTYNYDIDWGDGMTDTGVTGDMTHTYATAGIYTVSITGTFPSIYFNNGGDRRKIIEITSWGTIQWLSMEDAFSGCSSLNFDAIPPPDLSQVTSLRNMFKGGTAFNGILNGWNISTITDISGLFFNCTTFNRPLDAWVTGGITDMSDTFNNTRNFNEPLDNWQTGAVTTMARMFRAANSFNQNINNWNVSQVTDMSEMFENTNMSLPLNDWDVGEVTDMREMFSDTPFNQPLNQWDVNNVTNMSRMFYRCSFNQNINSWIVGNVTTMASMFERNTSFNQPLNGWDVANVTDMSQMFAGIFSSYTAFNQPLDLWVTDNVTLMYGMFRSSRFNQPIGGWNVSSVTNMASMFDYSPDFNQPIEGWDVSNVTTMGSMFRRTNSFNQPLNGWTTTSLTSMQYMFSQAIVFDQPLNLWDTSNVTTMLATFKSATVFDQSIGDWNIEAVTNLLEMLDNAGLSEANYDDTLIGWEAQTVTPNLTLGATTLLYCDGRFARQDLIDNDGWTIIGDIINCSFVLCTNIISPINGDTMVPANFNLVWEASPAATGYRLTIRKDTGGTITTILNNVNVGNVTTYDFPVDFMPGDIVYATVVPFNSGGPATGCIEESYTIVEAWNMSPDAFQLTYDTSITYSGSTGVNQLKISQSSGYTYDYSIDWGDDQFDNNVTGTITHTYDTPGVYKISIIGDYPAHFFNYSGTDSKKLLSIDQWGTIEWQTMRQAFLDCQNMTYNATDIPDLSQVTNMNNMFYSCYLFDGNINNWDVSNVTNMSNLFIAAYIYNQPMDQWDVSNVTTMSGMFLLAPLFNQPIGGWDVSNVTNMSRMFDGFGGGMAFNQPINNWEVDNVTNMFAMFNDASNFNQPLFDWNVSNVTNMDSMFERAIVFDQNIENWDVSNVITMESMFERANNYNQPLDLWDVSNVLDMESMFERTLSFNQPLNNWGVTSCIIMRSMFQGAEVFDQPIDGWDVATVTNTQSMFEQTVLFNQDISTWNVSQVTNMGSMFKGAISYDQPLAAWDVNSVVNMSSMFENAQVFNQPIGGWNVSAVANMTAMFKNAQLFDQLIDTWNVSSVTLMQSMFEEAQVFNQIINSWDVTSVTTTEAMFKNAAVYNQPMNQWDTGELLTTAEMFNRASSFNQNINSWNTSFVRTMFSMFEGATVFNQPLDSWNVASVTTMENMFKNALAFNQNVNDWNTRGVLTMEEMFHRANAFNQPLENWRVFNVTDMEEMFRDADSFDQDINNWDLETVNLRSMFRDADNYNQYLGDLNMVQVTNVSNMLDNTAIERMNYDNTLIAWSEQSLPSGLSLGANTLPYCDAFEERQLMMTTYGWSFNGDVLDCPIPVCTILSSPLDGAIDVPVNTNINWEPALFARGYRITVTVDPGIVIVNNLDVIDDTFYNFAANFNPSDVVRVTIIPFNDTGFATGCVEEMFTIINDPTITVPDCTQLNNPLNGAIDVVIDTDISWGAVSNADTYFLNVGTTPGGTNIVNNLDIGNVTTYDFPVDLPENTIIYVTIIPANDVGNATGCMEEFFTTIIIPVPPMCTTLSDPLNGAIDVPLDTNLTWNSVPNATGYLLTVGTTSGGIDVLNSIDVGNVLSYNFATDLEENRVHYVKIIPYNDVGDATGCAEESFRTELPSSVDAVCTNYTAILDATGNVTINPSDVDGGSSSTNGTFTLSLDIDTFDCDDVGANTVVLLVTDDTTGETASCSATVTVVDDIAPTIDCPVEQFESTDANCQFILPDYISLATITDNCGNVTTTQNPIPGTILGVGTTQITLTTSDSMATVTCTFDVTVEDNTNPVANCVAPFILPLDAAGMATITAADIDNGSTDECGIATTTIDITNFTCDDLGPNTVTLTIIDNNGNTTTCSTTVTIEDPLFACNTPPVANCQPVVVSANGDCEGIAVAADFDNGSFDPDGEPVTLTVMPAGPYPLGITNVTLIVDDGVLTSSCTTTITVNDTTPPTITCPDNITVSSDANCTFTLPDYISMATVMDNCSTVSVVQIPVAGTVVNAGVNTITLTASDGNTTTDCTFTVNVIDDTPPVASCTDITVQLDTTGNVTITPADVASASSDNCGIASVTIDVNSFDCSNVGPNNVVVTVTDTSGNVSNCTAIVTVEDVMPPSALCQNITVILDATGSATIVPSEIDNGSTDNCEIDNYALDIDTFDCSNLGANTVTLTVTDVNGNSSTCTSTVTVEETEPPAAVCQNITVALDAMGTISITPADVDGGSTDNCGNVTTTIDIDTFTCDDLGTNEVILTVEDTNGNVDSCTAIVTIIDETAPTALCQNITIELDSNGMAVIQASDLDGGSTDACGIANISIDIFMFDCSNLGENTVTLTITDDSGNEGTCEAIVTVIGTSGVQAECQNLTVPLGQNGTVTISPLSVYGGSLDISCPDNVLSIDIDTFTCDDIGTPVTVTLTAIDNNGITTTCQAQVNVVDTLAPLVMCPENQTVISTGPYELPDYFATGEATAIDNCTDPITVFDQDPSPGTLLAQGTYTITLTAEDNNGFEGECEFILVVDDILGANGNEQTLATIVLYPNPANEFFVISNPQQLALQQLSIYDTNGRLVQQEDISTMLDTKMINISALQSANYFIMIDSDFGQITKRLLKE